MRRPNPNIEVFAVLIPLVLMGCGRSSNLADKSANKGRAEMQRGRDALDKGDFDSAIAEFSGAIQLDPTNANAYYDRGLAYYKKRE
jgi:Tfp pilus assembly protein PilF